MIVYGIQKNKFIDIECWTIAKNPDPEKNEDVCFFDESVVVLADGATDKTGILYPTGKSGGRSLAEIAAKRASTSSKTGYALVNDITDAIRECYRLNNPDALTDPSKRASTTLAVCRLIGESLCITQVGDTNIRVTYKNGEKIILSNDKMIDLENAEQRSLHIRDGLSKFKTINHRQPDFDERKVIVTQGREVILARLKSQYLLQNSVYDAVYGYGIIDGTDIPVRFENGESTRYVKTYTYPAAEVETVELVSDGFYGAFPEKSITASYRALYENIHSSDPDKINLYKSTKSIDDATVVCARIIKNNHP